jgi:hypothetical protein
MSAYELEPWHDLFVAVAGVAAALGGFFFVAVSLNLEEVLKTRTLPSGGGLYWALLEICAGLTVTVYYSWILLIEIRR